MQHQILADSATTAAWIGAIGQWAGAGATFLAVLAALYLPIRERKRADADLQARLAAEVLAAGAVMQTALELIKVRANDWSARLPVLGLALAELLPDDRPLSSRYARSLAHAAGWQRDNRDFTATNITAASARLFTALTAISLCRNEDLHLAADGVRVAVGDALQSFGTRAGQARAGKLLEQALREFRAAAVRVTGAATR